MPLLGRHKPNSSGVSGAAGSGQQQPVCESPLFGIRRQLNLGSAQSSASSTPTGSSKDLTSNPQNQEPLMSSVPQQITRQQITYAFSMMDTNQDGMIDLRDLSQMLANLGIPIDEAILSHIMSSVSKRGDHRISEAEFLDWISHFIEVKDGSSSAQAVGPQATGRARGERLKRESPPLGRRPSGARGRSAAGSGSQAVAASTASLVAEQPEAQAPRTRRGSGSGLALMRSLGSSSKPAADSDPQLPNASSSSAGGRQQTTNRNKPQQAAADKRQSHSSGAGKEGPSSQEPSAESEARDDLKAAFGVFDLDGDGFITIDEVRAGLKLLGESWTPAELQQVFSGRSKSGSNGRLASAANSPDLSNQRISIDDFVQLLL